MAFRFNPLENMNTGLGLIYRLNFAMYRIEDAVLDGNYKKWNILLDRIYTNIMYKNPMDIIKDEDGKIINVKLSKEDVVSFSLLNMKVRTAFREYSKALKSKKQNLVEYTRSCLYNILMKKEMWLKKKMFELKLYLKEVSDEPGSAAWNNR
jgi:hypothetical protein